MRLQCNLKSLSVRRSFQSRLDDLFSTLIKATPDTIIHIAKNIVLVNYYKNYQGVKLDRYAFIGFFVNLFHHHDQSLFILFFKHLNSASFLWFFKEFRHNLDVMGFDEMIIPIIPLERLKELPAEQYAAYKKYLAQ